MKKLLFLILALAMPALASAGTYTVGLGLGYAINSDMPSGGDCSDLCYEYKMDSNIGISLFAEKNDVFIERLSLGLQYNTLGTPKHSLYDAYEDMYLKIKYGSLHGFGVYGRYTFINRPYKSGNIFGYGKFGLGYYSLAIDSSDYTGEDDDGGDLSGFGINIGIGAGYAFKQGTAITLSYDIHRPDMEWDHGGSEIFSVHMLNIAVQHRFDFSLGFGKANGESETAAWTSSKKSGSDDDNWSAGMNMSDYEKSSGNYKSEKPEESQPKAKPVKVKAETQKTVVSATLQDSGSEIVEPTPKITFGSKIKKAWRNMGRTLPAVKEYQRPASNNSWFGNGWFKVKETEN